jgi:hypothetical protein
MHGAKESQMAVAILRIQLIVSETHFSPSACRICDKKLLLVGLSKNNAQDGYLPSARFWNNEGPFSTMVASWNIAV